LFSGPEFIPSKQVEACLVSLQREVTATLPPLNWMGILSPLMKLQFGNYIDPQTIFECKKKISLC
jgi:hypothetical protein